MLEKQFQEFQSALIRRGQTGWLTVFFVFVI